MIKLKKLFLLIKSIVNISKKGLTNFKPVNTIRKGQVSSIPITQIVKIVAAILVAATILAIFIPMLYDGMDAACEMLRSLLEQVGILEMFIDYLEILEC